VRNVSPNSVSFCGTCGAPSTGTEACARCGAPAGRPAAQPAASPDPDPATAGVSRRVVFTIAGGLGIVALILVVLIVTLAGTPGVAPTDPSSADESPFPAEQQPARPSTLELPQLPIAPVSIGVPDYVDRASLSGVQVFADAMVSTSTDQMVRNCWTYAPDTVRDRYGTDQARGAVLQALSTVGEVGQTGAHWIGEHVTVSFINEELGSRYPCPVVTINGEPDRYDRVDAEWLVTRLAGRLAGVPVDDDDTEQQYFLECSPDPLTPWTIGPGEGPPILEDRSPVDAAVRALAGATLSVTALDAGSEDASRYWSLTEVGTSGPSLIVQTWGIRACVGGAG
jgi:hypothetical protein